MESPWDDLGTYRLKASEGYLGGEIAMVSWEGLRASCCCPKQMLTINVYVGYKHFQSLLLS